MTVKDEFLEIAGKYEVEEETAIHRFQSGDSLIWTLYRIIENEQARAVPLPEEFVKELEEKLVSVERKQWEDKGGIFGFIVGSNGKTMKEIREHQSAWNLHCNLHVG